MSDAFMDPTAMPPSSEVYLDQLEVARPVPASAGWPRVEDAANAVLEEAYYEPADRAEAGDVALAMLRATSGMFTERAA